MLWSFRFLKMSFLFHAFIFLKIYEKVRTWEILTFKSHYYVWQINLKIKSQNAQKMSLTFLKTTRCSSNLIQICLKTQVSIIHHSNSFFPFCNLIVQQLCLLQSVRKPHLRFWIHSHWFLHSFARYLSESAKMVELMENIRKSLRKPWTTGAKAVVMNLLVTWCGA